MAVRRKKSIVAGIAIAVVVAAMFIVSSMRRTRDITIEIASVEPQRLSARFLADGEVREETLTTPFKRSFRASRVSYWILPDDSTKETKVSIQVLIDDVPWWPLNDNVMTLGKGLKGTIQTSSVVRFNRDEVGTAGTSPEEIASIGYVECAK